MSNEELLKPRFKIVADYPNREQHGWQVGDIITLKDEIEGIPAYPFTESYRPFGWFNMLDKIFERLQWWEEREVGDMPNYMKVKTGQIVKIDTHFCRPHSFLVCGESFGKPGVWIWNYSPIIFPATEQEYNDFITSTPTK